MLFSFLLLVFTVSAASTWGWLLLARRLALFDHPNSRSSHRHPTPKSGGAGFILAFTIYAAVLYAEQQLPLRDLLLMLAGLLLAVTGFLDDLKNLGIFTRIAMQLLAAVAGLLLLGALPAVIFPWGALEAPWLLAPLYLLGFVWLVNLCNFMDGIDALAAAEAIFFCLALGLFAVAAQAASTSLLAPGLAVSLSAFLLFNLPPARLFMGDLGSNYLGFVLGMIGLLAIREGAVNIWTLLVLLGVFIVDATTTLLRRILAGSVWYHAHRSHAYQRAALRFGSHGRVVLLVCLINLFWLLPLALLASRREAWGLPVTLLAWTPLAVLVLWCRRCPEPGADLPADVQGRND